MIRRPVESSVIRSIGYDAGELMLEIEFHNGSIRQYLDVPIGAYTDLLSAESVGKYFNKHVKASFVSVEVKDEESKS